MGLYDEEINAEREAEQQRTIDALVAALEAYERYAYATRNDASELLAAMELADAALALARKGG